MSLEDAWKEAEAAIPAAAAYMALDPEADWDATRWAIVLMGASVSVDGKTVSKPWAKVMDLDTGEDMSGGVYGATPVRALRALAAKLRLESA